MFKDRVRFNGLISFGKDNAGEAIIKQGEDSAKIIFSQRYENTPIINASINIDDASLEDEILREGYIFAITQKSESGFTIKLNQDAKTDLKFSWTSFETNTN
ncbi:MAG: hypothetical protein HYT11_01825 [Candidatus Levybacteria bacterium]|nr:hypothetical protein [Candidatus Levybacteria bacterium]